MMSKSYYFIEEVQNASQDNDRKIERLLASIMQTSKDDLYHMSSFNMIGSLIEMSRNKLLSRINEALDFSP